MYTTNFSTLKELVESRHLCYEFYTRKKWYYVKITGWHQNHRPQPWWDQTVRDYYPKARLVRSSDTELVYNVGTVFDMIENGDQQKSSAAVSILRATMPTILANQIVGVQPMLGEIASIFSPFQKDSDDR